MFDFSISSQVRRGGFSIAGGRPSRLDGSVKGVRIKNIPPLSQLKPKITLMAALARSWATGSKKKGICKRRCLSFWQDTRIQNPWAVCDAILVGAETIRRDNPSLLVGDEVLRQIGRASCRERV